MSDEEYAFELAFRLQAIADGCQAQHVLPLWTLSVSPPGEPPQALVSEHPDIAGYVGVPQFLRDRARDMEERNRETR